MIARGTTDSISIAAGFVYAKNSPVKITVDATDELAFQTQNDVAFASDVTASIAAFQDGARASAVSPAPSGKSVTDEFSLMGFTAAYAAIVKACAPAQ